MIPFGASEGGAEATGAIQTKLWNLVCGNISGGRGDDDQGEEGGEDELVMGQGEDDTPEGWTFLNIYSFVKTELYLFWQKVKVKFSQKGNFVS